MNITRCLIAILAAAVAAPLRAPISVAAPAKSPAKGPSKAAKCKKAGLIVEGRIVALSRAPRPGSVPYKDAIIALRLRDARAIQGRLQAREVLVYVWGMRRNARTKAASYRVGQAVRLPLTPWERAEGKYGAYNRIELEGEDAYALDAFWGEAP